ncbi:hypothetical protein ACKGJO_06660 [Gracilimonas sp. Q87]|uniref:hypothetical protein n=1 Tax=Gracilimonas sp. Q87 TaxID=3384766 RepID=UPI00398460A5
MPTIKGIKENVNQYLLERSIDKAFGLFTKTFNAIEKARLKLIDSRQKTQNKAQNLFEEKMNTVDMYDAMIDEKTEKVDELNTEIKKLTRFENRLKEITE